jgi:LPXTG-motif cell wall-anchored protein
VKERVPVQKAPPLAPVAERRQLASTGLNPALIAIAGMLCLVGGAFLFRRAVVRN